MGSYFQYLNHDLIVLASFMSCQLWQAKIRFITQHLTPFNGNVTIYIDLLVKSCLSPIAHTPWWHYSAVMYWSQGPSSHNCSCEGSRDDQLIKLAQHSRASALFFRLLNARCFLSTINLVHWKLLQSIYLAENYVSHIIASLVFFVWSDSCYSSISANNKN